jgi:hypothetical protein
MSGHRAGRENVFTVCDVFPSELFEKNPPFPVGFLCIFLLSLRKSSACFLRPWKQDAWKCEG